MITALVDAADVVATPLTALSKENVALWLERQTPAARDWLAVSGFKGEPGSVGLLPGGLLGDGDGDGGLAGAVAVIGKPGEPWGWGALPAALPPLTYQLDLELAGNAHAGDELATTANAAALGWGLGAYRFTRYKAAEKPLARLAWPGAADRGAVARAIEATTLVRDLVNTPACDMGPGELELAARNVATDYGAVVNTVVGPELVAGFPAIHTVGRASPRGPRLVDLTWGDPAHPKVTLVGKGVCFDSGGLDIKQSSGMLNMKKDMGGAAHALALGRMVMDAGLPVRLRVLLPVVENVIDGSAFKPMDVIKTRKGLTVEVGNTDAEGRLILCDALALAAEEQPELIIDFATLTGAARVALGPDLPALFSNDDKLADDLLGAGMRVHDPLWRLPLWRPYAKGLEGKITDLSSTGSGGFAGAITAALFLEHFVSKEIPWAHIDLYAWNQTRRPGRPEGGEAMTLRAAFDVLAGRYTA